MTREEAIAHGKEQLDVFGGEHAEIKTKSMDAITRAIQGRNGE